MPILPRTTGRSLRAALLALSSLLLVTCTDNPAGPGGAGLGRLRLVPVFDAFARFAPLTLDNIRVIVVRAPSDTVANVPKTFNASNPQLRLDLPIPIQGVSEDLEVTLQLFAGSTLLFEGKDTVTVTAGGATQPASVPVLYQGPGGSIATLTLSPRDSSLQVGDTLAFLLNAADSQGAPVAQYYVSWNLTGGPDRSARLDATGRLIAPSKPDTFYVKVASPNGTLDSTTVTIIPHIAPGTVTWTGAVDTQWSTPGNWNTGALPSAIDSVVIPQATNHPVLTAAAAAGSINVTGGTLVVNGFPLTVARGFATTGSGTLTMTNQGDQVTVSGNARFAGGSTAGLLTQGHLTVGGNFTQVGSGNPQSFAADPGHTTELDAPTPLITFGTPGLTASHFGTLLEGFGTNGFDFGSDVAVSGFINSLNDGFFGPLTGSNVALTIPSLSGMSLDGVRLIIEDTSTAGFSGVFGVQFSNLPTSAAQLTIRNPGSSVGPFAVSSVTFVPLAGGNSGKYVNAIDADGGAPALTVYVDFDANNNGPGFTQTSGGAQVFWPSSPFVWTGATSTDWATNTNWNTLRTPFSNDVLIPSGTPNSPQLLSFPVTTANLTLQAGATLDLGTQSITVNGNLDNDGLISSVQGSGVAVTGNLRGAIDAPLLTFGSTLTGRLTVGAGNSMQVAGPFDLGGHTADIAGNFTITGTGDLRMTSAAGTDSLLVGNDALFSGGSTTGLLTSGVVRVTGNFASGVFSSSHYAPSGTHKTLLGGPTLKTVTIPTVGGLPSARFKVLDVSGATGGLSLLGTMTAVDSLFISTPSAGTPTLFGGGDSLMARRVQVSRLTIDQVPITIDELGTALAQQFDNVTFQNDTTSTLLNLVLVGTALAPRTVTFNSSVFSFNGSNTYVQLVSSNGQGVTVVINGSNNPTGGPSRSNPAFGATVNGAKIQWQ